MKADDVKTKTVDELEKLLVDLKKQQFNLRFQRSQGQLQNTAQLRAVKRDVARVQTFIMQKTQADKPAKVSKAPKAALKAKKVASKDKKTAA